MKKIVEKIKDQVSDPLKDLKSKVIAGDLQGVLLIKDIKEAIEKDTDGKLIKDALGANPKILKYLLENGLKVDNVIDHLLNDAFKLDTENKINCIKLLTSGDGLEKETKDRVQTELKEQLKTRKNSFLTKFINKGSNASQLFEISKFIPSFINLGADVNGHNTKQGEKEQTPLVALIEKWNEDNEKDSNREAYLDVAESLILNGALPNEKVMRSYEGKKMGGATALDIMDSVPNQAENFAAFKDRLRLMQGKFGEEIRKNRMQRVKYSFNTLANSMRKALGKDTVVMDAPANIRSEKRKLQKSVGEAIRNSR